MGERLIDVFDGLGRALHTFPVLIENTDASDDDYQAKALKLAAHVRLVAPDDLPNLTAKPHVSRPGPVVPIGDDRHILSGTKQGHEKTVGVRAYFIWQQDGCPEGRAVEHWFRAFHQHLRERAYFIWLSENCPEGRADAHWRQAVEFETYF